MVAQAALYGGMAALELASGYFASQNIKDSARLNQDIAEMNSKYAELDAYDALAEGQTEQARYQKVIDQTMGSQQLAMTAANVDTSYGSARDIGEESKFIGQLNLMEIEKHAQEKALGFKTQARQFHANGIMEVANAKSKAASVMFNSGMGAAKTGLSGYRAGAFDFGSSQSREDKAFQNEDFSIA